MKLSVNEIILYFFVPIWIVAEILISIWMFKAKPGKNIAKKYPKKIIFLSQLLFGKRWRQPIDKEHVRLFETYQYRIRVWYLSLMIPFVLTMFIFASL